MTDMTAEERTTIIYQAWGGDFRTVVTDQIRQVERAARRKALAEAAAVAGTLAERPYDSEPEFSCATTIEACIRALMDNSND